MARYKRLTSLTTRRCLTSRTCLTSLTRSKSLPYMPYKAARHSFATKRRACFTSLDGKLTKLPSRPSRGPSRRPSSSPNPFRRIAIRNCLFYLLFLSAQNRQLQTLSLINWPVAMDRIDELIVSGLDLYYGISTMGSLVWDLHYRISRMGSLVVEVLKCLKSWNAPESSSSESSRFAIL